MDGADIFGVGHNFELECDVKGGADFCFMLKIETGLKGHIRGCATPQFMEELKKFGVKNELGCTHVEKDGETGKICLCDGDLCNAD